MIYLDNAATTFPLPGCVCSEMDRLNRSLSVNAGRGSYKLATEAARIIEQTREKLGALFGADKDRVFFSPSATIGINQVLGGRQWSKGEVVYVSPYEHNSVLRPLYSIAKRYGIDIQELPLNSALEIDLSLMKDKFSLNKPSLVCCTHVSNVTGYILPIKDICKAAKDCGAEVLIDASQSAGLLKIDMKNVDYLVFAGHKTLYGPFGAAGVVLGKNVSLAPFICGGTGSDSLNLDMPASTPLMYEPGSMNVSAIGGLGAAVDFIMNYPTKHIGDELCENNSGIDNILMHEKALTERLIEGLSKIEGVRLYLPRNLKEHIGIVSFNIEGYTADECGQILDMDFDIAVRTGYHCAALIHKYLKIKEHLGTVRASVGAFTKEEDVDALIRAVKSIAEE